MALVLAQQQQQQQQVALIGSSSDSSRQQGMQLHDLGSQGLKVRWLPFAPPGPPDLDGRTNAVKLLALAHYSGAAESHLLSFGSLQVASREEKLLGSHLEVHSSFQLASACTDIKVVELDGGEVVLAVATAEGALHLGRLLIPRTPGALPSEADILSLPADGLQLRPWLQPHRGAVSSVDVHADSKALLSCGVDGSIFVLPTDASLDASSSSSSGAGGAVPFKRGAPGGCVSYSCARWVDSQAFVTSSSSGGLERWDLRQGPSPVARAPQAWCSGKACGSTPEAQLLALEVHPLRPHLCASGCASGAVALWDLRFSRQALQLGLGLEGAAGCVWEVHFDASVSGTVPRLLYCTEGGLLGAAGPSATASGEGLVAGPPLLQHPSSVNSFDVAAAPGGQQGVDVVAVTDSMQLAYMRVL